VRERGYAAQDENEVEDEVEDEDEEVRQPLFPVWETLYLYLVAHETAI
jgi:hypothetical protein